VRVEAKALRLIRLEVQAGWAECFVRLQAFHYGGEFTFIAYSQWPAPCVDDVPWQFWGIFRANVERGRRAILLDPLDQFFECEESLAPTFC
jgi:hypothetical protein